MAAEIISGRDLAHEMRQEMKQKVTELNERDIYPKLSVILVGDNPASKSYVNGKKKACKETGILSDVIELASDTTEAQLLQQIEILNEDPTVHGILVQLPLPKQIREQKVIDTISYEKDVDGFHPINIGRMMTGEDAFLPCTPFGIITMLKSKNIQIAGKHAVVVGRSNIVGKPVGQLLLNEDATVTYCHSKTKNLKQITQQADILIAAVGKVNAIGSEDIKEDAVVIDVGINRLEDGSLTGDVDFEAAKEKASYITPVPRGVGPMTITMLLENTIKAAKGLTK
ncbi:bifunctional methylenetetrahydrofolate dehydrogenase/methenyltetrahydrofolate cyclohydrolase FolD [Oceanobacillus manasiensis]|uniref:bifunctional methylenetetrahydrofolate dehydrogenase/methenyltetrahydrofolate cyclohydrolase FolD n=1 Tax=Oceanobacillus manasiensis TaxID=586413 RepID=UPI0005A9CFA3|nr:bifunctional methylenetetrahydrofolate dehydrogenase/methenyltetrahydrofolate cyclohydrolase FolD [Oceanobacillus manasiensis]